MLESLFDRFTKYLNDNDSILIFKYDGNKIKYSFKGDDDHWYNWFKERDDIKDRKDERLKFFIGKRDSFFNCPFRNKHKYKTINKCINFLHNSTSLEEIVFKMELMGI